MNWRLLVRRRWRAVLWVVILTVLLFDVVAFIVIPSFRSLGLTSVRDSYGSVYHLQIVRKQSNKSSANFSSSNFVNSQLKTELFSSEVSQEKIIPQSFHKNKYNQIILEGSSDSIIFNNGSPTLVSDEIRNYHHLVVSTIHFVSTTPNSSQGFNKGHSNGARTNYSKPEVEEFVKKFQYEYNSSDYSIDMKENYADLLKRLNGMKKTGLRLPLFSSNKGTRSWEKFYSNIRQHFLYDPADPTITELLHDLSTEKIVAVEQKEGGTQIKLIIKYENGAQALFKPMRYGREQETLPDHFYFADFERHNAEIAAFHLDKVLGFYRVPPTIGRLVNLSSEIQPISSSKLEKTFFVSPAGNLCFHGSCSYYCDSSHPICGHPTMLEGSLAIFLPPSDMAKRKTWKNPWKRSYSKHRKAYWETYDDLCERVQQKAPYNEGHRLLDIMDMSVFDFLTGNLDRHHFETFKDFGNETFLLHLDNGRAFGKSKYDCMSCMAPVRQCCMIRLSTLTKLIKLYVGPDSLSQVLRSSLTSDPLNPILVEPHLDALDRRVSKIFEVINLCIVNGKPWDKVIVDDGAR